MPDSPTRNIRDEPTRQSTAAPKTTEKEKAVLGGFSAVVGLVSGISQFGSQFAPPGVLGVVISVTVDLALIAATIGGVRLFFRRGRWLSDRRTASFVIVFAMVVGVGVGFAFKATVDGHPGPRPTHSPGAPTAADSSPAESASVSPSTSVAPAGCGRPDLVLPTNGPPDFTIEVHPGCAPAAGVTRWIMVELHGVGDGNPHSEYYFVWKVTQATVYTLKPNIGDCPTPRSYYIVDATDAQYTEAIKTGRTSDRMALDLGDIPVESPIHNYRC